MSKFVTCLSLFVLTALAMPAAAQDAAVQTAAASRPVRVQPVMRHVGARLCVQRPATTAVRDAGFRAGVRPAARPRVAVHFRH